MRAITFLFLVVFVSLVSMQRITNYVQVGTNFVQQYYASFDNDYLRLNVQDFYDTVDSVLVYGSGIYFGADQILNKFKNVTTVIQRNISATDCQPTNDTGVIVNVYGRILYKSVNNFNNNSLFFTEMFVLKPRLSAYYVQNQHHRATAAQNNTLSNADGLHFASA